MDNPTLNSTHYEVLGSYEGIESRFSLSPPKFIFENGFFTGYDYDSLEFIRRWCQQTKKLNFYGPFDSSSFWSLKTIEKHLENTHLLLRKIPNGSLEAPLKNSILVWNKPADSAGHFAIITEVNLESNYIRIAEQGRSHDKWQGDYSRELALTVSDSAYTISGDILGWIQITDSISEGPTTVQRIEQKTNPVENFLDLSDPRQAAWGDDKTNDASIGETMTYYTWSSSYFNKILTTTEELHHMCMLATERVLSSDSLMNKFKIPEVFWPMIRQSWQTQKHFHGRFDLAVDGKSAKMFEYNADSAGILLETSCILNRKAVMAGCDVGEDAGKGLEEALVRFWQKNATQERIHLLIDEDDPEETYIARYMENILRSLGADAKISVKNAGLSWTADRRIVDSDGVEVKKVWKLWNWNTLFKDYFAPKDPSVVSLSDVMINSNVSVTEPMWKVIPSNKAVLSVLWDMFPGHPNLLKSSFDSNLFTGQPYVAKPISGRLGENITIFDQKMSVSEQREGQFSDNDYVFQEFFELLTFEGYRPVVSVWIVEGRAFGLIVREEKKLITEYASPMLPCRVIPDD